MVRKEDFVPGITYHFTHPCTGEHLATAVLNQWEAACAHAHKASEVPAPPAEKVTEKAHWDLALQRWVMKDKDAPLDHKKHEREDYWVFDKEMKRLRLLEEYASNDFEAYYRAELLREGSVVILDFYGEDLPTLITYKTQYAANEFQNLYLPSHGGRTLQLRGNELNDVITGLRAKIDEVYSLEAAFVGSAGRLDSTEAEINNAEKDLERLKVHRKKPHSKEELRRMIAEKRAKKT